MYPRVRRTASRLPWNGGSANSRTERLHRPGDETRRGVRGYAGDVNSHSSEV